jgi:immunity protein 5 of polymorphic toxin system
MTRTRAYDGRISEEPLYVVLDGADRGAERTKRHSLGSPVALPGEPGATTAGEVESSMGRYHLCRIEELVDRIGPAIYEADCREEPVDAATGVVAPGTVLKRRPPLWNRCTTWSFACDCAEHVLALFERAFPYDDRPRRALETTRRHLAGQATADELNDAWNAVHHAIQEIRRDIPWDAGFLAGSAAAEAAAGECQAAVWMATRAAARAPRWTTLWVAAWTASHADLGAALAGAWETASREERAWQAQRLKAYLAGAVPEARTTDERLGSRAVSSVAIWPPSAL